MKKKKYFKRSITFIITICAYLLFGLPNSFANPIISTVPVNEQPTPGDSVEVHVNVDLSGESELLGAYSIQLTWNPSVLEYAYVTGGTSVGYGSPLNKSELNVSTGSLLLNKFYSPGTGGIINIAQIYFTATGSPGDTTTVGLIVNSLTASSASNFKDLTVSLEVNTALVTIKDNSPPVITTTSLPNAVQNQLYKETIEATDPDEEDTHSFALVSGPDWLSIDATSGELTGIPGNDDVGTDIAVVVEVIDSGGLSNEFSTIIDVINKNDTPVILSDSLPDGIEDQEYSFTLEVEDIDEGDSLTFELITGPAWLSINTLGVLSGIPSDQDVGADVRITIMVQDIGGLRNYITITIDVINVNNPPKIITPQIPNATSGANYSYKLEVNDPDINDSLAYEILDGPEWLSIDNEGILNGNPGISNVGTNISIRIMVTDDEGLSDELSCIINVISDNEPPQILTTSIPDAYCGEEYLNNLKMDDPNEGDILTYDLSEGPEWLAIHESGVLYGKPENEDAGTGIPITVRVTDFGGLFDEVSFKLNVLRTDFGILSGAVVERYTGVPIENATIILGENYFGVTDNIGEFTISDILAGEYTLEVSAEFYQPYTGNASILLDQTTEVQIELNMALGFGAIAGNVFELNSGLKIENVTIYVIPGNLAVTTDSDGYYIIENLQAGTNSYEATASAENYIPFTQSPIYVNISEEPRKVDFYLAEINTPQVENFTADMDEYQVVGEEENLLVTTTISISSLQKIAVKSVANKIVLTEKELYISNAELYFNNDPSFGNGYPMEAADGAFDEATEQVMLTVDVSNLFDGIHNIFVRALNSEEEWGYSASGVFKKGVVIEPPVNVETFDIPNDIGHKIRIRWEASSSENEGLVEYYRIYRSRSYEFNGPISINEITSLDSLKSIEKFYAVLIDSIPAGIIEYEYIDTFVPVNGVLYSYWIQAVSSNSASKLAPLGSRTFVENQPVKYYVYAPYPNPFNSSITIQYSITTFSKIKLEIFNIQGQKIKTLVDRFEQPGMYTVVWDATDDYGDMVGSGIYIYQLFSTDFRAQKQMLLLR